MTEAGALHPDFGDLRVQPGEAHINARTGQFSLLNVIEFGAAAGRPTHVPAELGRVGNVALWESTGAADQLPFWNTNYDGDAYLYIVHGSVHIEFKQTDGDTRYGHYDARTGDLFNIPRNIAHRTFSGDGRRRITLEIVPDNPFWATIGTRPIVADRSLRVGGFSFALTPGQVVVTAGGAEYPHPRPMFMAALRALRTYELHLGHNELDGGLTVHDLGDEVVLTLAGHREQLDGRAVLGVFQALLDEPA